MYLPICHIQVESRIFQGGLDVALTVLFEPRTFSRDRPPLPSSSSLAEGRVA